MSTKKMPGRMLHKMKGVTAAPPLPDRRESVASFMGSLLALGLIGLLHGVCLDSTGLPLLMAPFGASAVLVFGASGSPLAQPRNVIGGHVLSAAIGVTLFHLVGQSEMLAVSLAVPAAIAAMHLTGTLHPPGGATAFVAASGGSGVHAIGYWYVLTPCAVGSVLMVAIALVVNNISDRRQYPLFW